MKRTWIAVLATALVTSLAWYVFICLRSELNSALLMSGVIAPGRMALKEIADDMEAERLAAADRKIDALRRQWRVFEEECGVEGVATGKIMLGNIMLVFADLEEQDESGEKANSPPKAIPNDTTATP